MVLIKNEGEKSLSNRKSNKAFVFKTLAFIMIAVLLLVGCTSGNNDNGKGVIKIGSSTYDYEFLPIDVAKLVAEEQGYEVDIVEGDIGFMFLSLQQGDIDIWPGIWLPNLHATYDERFGDDYELGGIVFEDAPTGWAVPGYVDIHSIEDLVGNEALFDHKLLGFEHGSGMMLLSEETIEAYDLDIELIPGSVASMLVEVDYAMSQEEPLLYLGWRPHPMFQKYDMRILEDPKGFWSTDDEYWGIQNGFEEKAPDLYRFIKNFAMDIDTIEQHLDALEQGEKREDLAKQWLEENRALVEQWLEQ